MKLYITIWGPEITRRFLNIMYNKSNIIYIDPYNRQFSDAHKHNRRTNKSGEYIDL